MHLRLVEIRRKVKKVSLPFKNDFLTTNIGSKEHIIDVSIGQICEIKNTTYLGQLFLLIILEIKYIISEQQLN